MQVTLLSPGSTITADQARLFRDSGSAQNFSQVLNAAREKEDDRKLYEACQQLESVFMQQVLGAMRSTIPRSDLLERGFATETFESMLYDEYAGLMSKNGAPGIADILYKQLSVKI